ncbi:MAG: GRP family sugar transporter [Thermoplasmatota archaeon]
MSELLGYAGVIAAVLAFGTYLVPMRQLERYEPFLYQWVMCTAIFCFSLVAALALDGLTVSLYGVATGLLWTAGNVLSIIAVQRTGLATASPIWMSLVVLSAFAWGILYFGEEVSSPGMTVGGLALLIAGIGGISLVRRQGGPVTLHGILYAGLAGVTFGSMMVPFKLSGLSPTHYILSIGVGVLLGGWLLFALARPHLDGSIVPAGTASGAMWMAGNLGSLIAVDTLGLTVGQPLTQTALFISVLWGIIYFREVQSRRGITLVAVSAAVLFAGSVLLSLGR